MQERRHHIPYHGARVPVAVGYHSGSHFSALQALGHPLGPENVRWMSLSEPEDAFLSPSLLR